jgi:hypothetical protein
MPVEIKNENVGYNTKIAHIDNGNRVKRASGALIGTETEYWTELSATEVLSLNATPQIVVPAAGVGKIIIPRFFVVFLDYNSIPYAGIGGTEDLTFRYTDGSGVIVATLESTGFLDQTSDQYRVIFSVLGGYTPVINSPIVLQIANGEVTSGNSPLKIQTYYNIIDTGF